jgi:hypothetical protein
MGFGALLLFCPHELSRWVASWNRRLAQPDKTILKHRVSTALCLLAIGVFCAVSAYYVWIRLHLL